MVSQLEQVPLLNMKRLYVKISIIQVLFWSACTTIKTTDKPQPAKLDGYSLLKNEPQFIFEPKLARQFFNDLLQSEGVSKIPMNLHKNEGLVTCQGTKTLTQCTLYTVNRGAKKTTFSNPVNLRSSRYEDLIDYYTSIGGFVNFEDRIVSNVLCNFIGLKSPPFGKETINCRLVEPRFSNETIFSRTMAKTLTYYLIKEKGFKPGEGKVNGTIRCTEIKNSPKCMIKATKTNKSIKMKSTESKPLIKKLLETAEIIKLTQPKFQIPSKRIFGAVHCEMHFATQKFACQVKI